MQDKYINPFTDYGFKRLFGHEPNKNILIDFLNELLKEQEGEIKTLTYLKNEHLGSSDVDRKAIFDLYCENDKGEKFIVELQKTKQNFFKDRTLYYSTFPIVEQAKRSNWNYELKAVYTIGILDFVFDEDKENKEKYRYDVKLTDIDTNKVFYDKLTFIYLEMPKFNKDITELKNRYEKWLYVIRNLNKLDRIPVELQEKIFEQFFQTAEISKMTKQELLSYEDSLKYYRDLKNSLDTAKGEGIEIGIKIGREKGREIGKEEGIEIGEYNNAIKAAKKMLSDGLSIEIVSKYSGLTLEDVKKLQL
ncbi:Rpn family recombination-promoting nuclease/putative transposase [Flammeovirga kamogawensis]|uniref:Rpn family recombination-promoting nuclease/putative transposase n=1 Tax=Flammeovirga kamogawensis TaxID=373891 RepID=A0ABX8GYN7_9BACT|nr:Rpn family recombination-promoting nuclease/putative transposase [Flammeovirga kamogawensis]MBB6458881.1 putative transposase/invertase (TIGR01784 family) [Flammeovirga kamogawensis]QWG08462.1 Rpn family recombination-promoting nuclease/putative transposase [Flammeovirga kamogawensis]TRX66758.1 Rpn family recombination-promoting nuclease/putative transposase [Flammeovirga kamogawensis]